MKEEFLNLLRSVKREGIDDLIRFIENTDFFYCTCKYKISWRLCWWTCRT